ncbi:unnamed protein product [Umbelopsis ramanniana]
MKLFTSAILVLALASNALAASKTPEIEHGLEKVTCGSIIKLTNVDTGYKLHSHTVAYASGSGQQSVTAHSSSVDSNSFWKVQASHGRGCLRGEPIPCGASIRLHHVGTKGYLHSHNHQSPLSRQQEVSCFDKEDTGDDWRVVCTGKSKEWMREESVRLVHVETKKYLSTSPRFTFAAPISGQLEVSCGGKDGSITLWAAQEGVYFA